LTSITLVLFIAVTANCSFPKYRLQALIFKILAFAKLTLKYRPRRSNTSHLATLFAHGAEGNSPSEISFAKKTDTWKDKQNARVSVVDTTFNTTGIKKTEHF